MIAKNQAEILELFRKNIFLSRTIREISIMLKKSYPGIYDAAVELEKKKVIKMRKAGNAKICELNLSKEAISIMSFLDEQDAFSRDIPKVNKIIEFGELREDIILVTGSYAKGAQTSKSDMDLAVITPSEPFKKQKLIENMTALFLPKIHPIAISYKDFVKMLIEKEESYGKEIFRNRLVFKNAERYYELIREAADNGFKG
jgi:predicted nucleotidyltransferase